MHVRSKKEPDESCEGQARPARRRRRQRLCQHHEGEEEQRRGKKRLARAPFILRGRGRGEYGGEVNQDGSRHEIEALKLANDQEAADHHDGQQRQVASDPPGRRPAQQQGRQEDAQCRRIEHMLTADGEDELRRHRPYRGEDKDTHPPLVGSCHGFENQREDQCGDVGRLAVGRDAEDPREDSVGDPARAEDQNRREGNLHRIMRHDLQEAEHQGSGDQHYQIADHQPVHGDAIEKRIDGSDHGAQYAPKPLVRVARPLLSTK